VSSGRKFGHIVLRRSRSGLLPSVRNVSHDENRKVFLVSFLGIFNL
jgi:hypothetical protein